MLPLSQTLLLTLGFDRTFCIFELHALGRFTDRVLTLHTLGQTLTTSHHLTPFSLLLPQPEGSLQKLLLWKDYTHPLTSNDDDNEAPSTNYLETLDLTEHGVCRGRSLSHLAVDAASGLALIVLDGK